MATLAVVVVYVLSDNGTALEAVGAAVAACGMFVVGFAVVISLERRLSRSSRLAVVAEAAPLRSTRLTQRSVSVREAVTPLLDESELWISILRNSPPANWTQAVLLDQEDSLAEIHGSLVGSRAGDAQFAAARERLAGYLTRLRQHYDGASAYEVQRQISS